MTTAPYIIAWFLRLNHVRAITMPWKTIYCLPGNEGDAALYWHEQTHIKQIERDGAVWWVCKICWYLLRYGYKKSPYESA